MESETLSNQPQLALNPQQVDIISAHMADAIQHMSNLEFRAENKENAILFHAYQKGRKDMTIELLRFDALKAEAAKQAAEEAATNNSQES